MNNGLLGKRKRLITDQRAVGRNIPPVYPRIEYPVRLPVIVVLKVIHDQKLFGIEVPDVALPDSGNLGLIDLIHFPIIRSV